jgi:hypothetical protein
MFIVSGGDKGDAVPYGWELVHDGQQGGAGNSSGGDSRWQPPEWRYGQQRQRELDEHRRDLSQPRPRFEPARQSYLKPATLTLELEQGFIYQSPLYQQAARRRAPYRRPRHRRTSSASLPASHKVIAGVCCCAALMIGFTATSAAKASSPSVASQSAAATGSASTSAVTVTATTSATTTAVAPARHAAQPVTSARHAPPQQQTAPQVTPQRVTPQRSAPAKARMAPWPATRGRHARQAPLGMWQRPGGQYAHPRHAVGR